MPSKVKLLFIPILAILLVTLPAMADRTVVKSGLNLFSVQQDIEIGRELAQEAERSMYVINDDFSRGYINALGTQLATHAPGHKYPYSFKIVDDDAVNSFALPNGTIYVTRGMVEAAQTEPQLAGVLAHQIAHVALRHGSQQLSKAWSAAAPGTSSRNISVQNVLDRLNVGFDSDSLVLKHSADIEQQADIVAAQILMDARFDPRQMPAFLQRLGNNRLNASAAFFKSHPGISNRNARVRREIQNMGGLPRSLRGDSPDLHKLQDHLEQTASYRPEDGYSTGDAPALPSSRMRVYQGREFDFSYPENWRVTVEDSGALTAAPTRGIVSESLAYGMRIGTFEPEDSSYFGQTPLTARGQRNPTGSLTRATDQLIDDFRNSNPNMRVMGSEQRITVDGEPALATEFSNDSPAGGREVDWIVTTLGPDGLLYYFIGVAPERDFARYKPTFERMIESIRFNY